MIAKSFLRSLILGGFTLTSVFAQLTVHKEPVPDTDRVTDVAFGNGRFVILADQGPSTSAHWSEDGYHWTPSTTELFDFGEINFFEGHFYYVYFGDVWRSPDGDVWSKIHTSGEEFQASTYSTSESGVLVFGGSSDRGFPLNASSDGTTWTGHRITDFPTNYLFDLDYGDQYHWGIVGILPIGSGSTTYRYVRTSGDSLDLWQTIPVPGLSTSSPGLAHGNGRLIIANRDAAALSLDAGRTVTARPPLPGFSSRPLYAQGYFFTSNDLHRSTDGINWTGPMIDQDAEGLTGLPWGFEDIAYGNGRYVIGGSVREGAVFRGLIAVWETPAPAVPQDLPRHHEVIEGRNHTLSLGPVDSASPVTYQWFFENTAIEGATEETLTFPGGVRQEDAGLYRCELTNAVATASSDNIEISVIPADHVGRLSNLSVRGQAGAGAQTLVTGMVLGGVNTTGSSPLLIRGVGPTLADFGITAVLDDPQVRLFDQTNVQLAENDNWGGNPELSAQFALLGAFPLTDPGSADSALLLPGLTGGLYSIHTAGNSGQTGIALSEIYENTPAIWPAPRLINLSCRSVAGSGDEALIVGFVVAGERPFSALIRAVGPTLEQSYGVSGILANPSLSLQNQTEEGPVEIAANDDWDPTTLGIQQSLGAFDLVPNSADAVLVVTLQPGVYSAIVSSNGAASGVALLEVYEIP